MATPFDPVRFTRESAERIANVVQAAEAAPPKVPPLRFGRQSIANAGSSVKFAAYTATSIWPVVSYTAGTAGTHAMTICFLANTGATAVCLNHLAWLPILGTVSTACTRTILVTKEAGVWRLIGAQA